MTGLTIRLTGDAQRAYAYKQILRAPDYAVVTIKPGDRTPEQNDKMWAMLTDVARAMPEGRKWTTNTWKNGLMHLRGWEMQFYEGLEGSGPFATGYSTRRLSKADMSEFIEHVYAYGSRHGVEWNE